MKRLIFVCLLLASPAALLAADVPVVENVELQPLVAQVNRLTEALDVLGEPLPDEVQTALKESAAATDRKAATRQIQETLDPLCLFVVSINPEMRVKVAQGPAKPELVAQGWRQFLVKVLNE